MSEDQSARILAAIESLGTVLRAEIVELRGDMVTHADLTALRAEMVTRAEIATLRADIMARIDHLQDRLTAEREGGIVTLGAAERAERIAKETRADVEALAEQIGALTRQIRVLSSRVDQLEGRH